MKPKPSVLLAVALFAAYTVVWIGSARLLQPNDADFGDAFADLTNSRYLLYGLLCAIGFGVLVATAFGWWRKIFADDRRTLGPATGWHRHVPLIVLVMILVTTDYPAFGDIEGEVLAWIVAASVAVGFSEELMFRGNVIVALRGAVPESRVWLISSVLFALIHFPNFVLGAPVAGAIINTTLAFLGGTLFYVMRRVTGTIIVAMAFHAAWDFTLFTADQSAYGGVRMLLVLVLTIGLIVTRHRLFDTADETPAVSA